MSGWTKPILAGIAAAVLGGYGATLAIPGMIMGKAVEGAAARGGGVNIMAHGKLSSPTNQFVVRPSPDLAYSICPFDLTKGPVRVDVVPVAGRYSSLSIFDANTDVAFVRNDVQAGGKSYAVVIAKDGQATPPGADVVRVQDDRGLALIRLLLADPSELPGLEPVRRQSRCGPVSG
jgi:uncharacterized membrane protein